MSAPPPLGVPARALIEAEGHTVTVDTNTGVTYRGKLIKAEDNMSCILNKVTATYRDGSEKELEDIYIRGTKIRFVVIPESLMRSSIFRPMPPRGGGGGRFGRRGRGGPRPSYHRRY